RHVPRPFGCPGQWSPNAAEKGRTATVVGGLRRVNAPCVRQISGCSIAGSTVSPRRNGRGSCRRQGCCGNTRALGVARARSGPAPPPFAGSPDPGSSTRESSEAALLLSAPTELSLSSHASATARVGDLRLPREGEWDVSLSG